MNRYKPRLTLKQLIEHMKYAKLERQLKPLCRWVNFYDYIWSYDLINWNNKTVVDIGADIGSSAMFFLMHGASYVYLIEKKPEYKKIYRRLKQQYPILKNTEMLQSIKDIPEGHFNVLKMDCEGCEQRLLTEDLLKRAYEFVIGLHKPPLDDYQFEVKKRLLEKYRGKYFGSVNNVEHMWMKVFD